jgi:tRNA(Ile)-lysidine synthase
MRVPRGPPKDCSTSSLPKIGVKASYGEYFSRVRMQSEAVTAIHRSLASLPRGRWLLAVSGGRDSMVLLDAMASARGHEIAAIATFNHGTGAAATRAARLVERTAMGLELPVVSGAMPGGKANPAPTEATWRAARWRFLNGWAEEMRATVVTAHTRDDQIETVLLRLLRDAGPRGLAGMLAEPSRVARPLLEVSREQVVAYAATRHVRFIEDPSNRSLAHQRNRVRHELLPALERAQPGFGDWCWDLSRRSAAWRRELLDFVDTRLAPTLVDGALVLALAPVRGLTEAGWAMLWPELAARIGVTMDWRGIARASEWASTAKTGAQIPLSGGALIERTRTTFVLRAASRAAKEGGTQGVQLY